MMAVNVSVRVFVPVVLHGNVPAILNDPLPMPATLTGKVAPDTKTIDVDFTSESLIVPLIAFCEYA